MKDHRLASYLGDKVWVWTGGVFKDKFPEIERRHPGYGHLLAFRFADPKHPAADGHPLYAPYYASKPEHLQAVDPGYLVAGRKFKNIDRAIAHATKLALSENRHVSVEIQGW